MVAPVKTISISKAGPTQEATAAFIPSTQAAFTETLPVMVAI
jgi:hypothetical protein